MHTEPTGYNITDQYGTYFMTHTFVGWIDLLTRLELKEIIVHLKAHVDKTIQYSLIASNILFGFLAIYIMTQNFLTGITILLGIALITWAQYLIFNYGLNGFCSDLENDIIQFK